MATRVVSNAEVITHDNYTTSTGGATKTLPHWTCTILIQNMDATNNVLVSFNGGTTYKTILPLATLIMDVDNVLSYVVKSSASTPAAECIYGSETYKA